MNSRPNPFTSLLRRRNVFHSLKARRGLESGPRITVVGGGTGLPSLIRGIKHYTHNISAIVTMADDGGSSGRLRSELGIQPPGDIRNCLVAMADSEAVMQQLMDYRFSSDGQLDGHSFGNMLIAALSGIGGDFYRAVEIAGELLAIRGRVIPSTISDVTLIARTETGETLTGETKVASASARLETLTLCPPNPPAHPEAVAALEQADLVIVGPGSLYTSIVPTCSFRASRRRWRSRGRSRSTFATWPRSRDRPRATRCRTTWTWFAGTPERTRSMLWSPIATSPAGRRRPGWTSSGRNGPGMTRPCWSKQT